MWKLGLRPRNSLKRNTQMGFSLQCSLQNAIYDSCNFFKTLCSCQRTCSVTWARRSRGNLPSSTPQGIHTSRWCSFASFLLIFYFYIINNSLVLIRRSMTTCTEKCSWHISQLERSTFPLSTCQPLCPKCCLTNQVTWTNNQRGEHWTLAYLFSSSLTILSWGGQRSDFEQAKHA